MKLTMCENSWLQHGSGVQACPVCGSEDDLVLPNHKRNFKEAEIKKLFWFFEHIKLTKTDALWTSFSDLRKEQNVLL